MTSHPHGIPTWSRISRAAAFGMELPYLLAHEDEGMVRMLAFVDGLETINGKNERLLKYLLSTDGTRASSKQQQPQWRQRKNARSKAASKVCNQAGTLQNTGSAISYCATQKFKQQNGHHITTRKCHIAAAPFHMRVLGQNIGRFHPGKDVKHRLGTV